MKVIIRKVEVADEEEIWKIRNSTEIRMASKITTPISLVKHKKWFKKEIAKKNRNFWVAEANGGIIGYARLSYSLPKRVSIAIRKDARRTGAGKRLITKVKESRIKTQRIEAEVKKENAVSKDFFISCGFTLLREDKDYYYLIY